MATATTCAIIETQHIHIRTLHKLQRFYYFIILLHTSCTRPRVAVAHSGATEAGTRNMEMLHVGVLVNCMFNGTFKADRAVLPPGSNVAAIPDDTRATAMSLWDRIAA
jgi:hypothetical protein